MTSRLLLCAAALLGCADPVVPPAGPASMRAELVTDAIDAPLHLTAPAGDERLFVVEQAGRIRIIDDGAVHATPFLDIRNRVRSGGEQGLLSVAFDPAYAANGRFYVHYTDLDGDTRVERYSVSGDRNVADPATAELILAVEQPFANHNGGQLAFGPDGMLYVGLGDGGSGGDPQGHGQNLATLLGSLLRLDVTGAAPYAIPAGNPFRNQAGARPEIWAFGLRNPWRFSFDRPAGTLYIADVGQNRFEEINARPAGEAGLNYGWNVMEGSECYASGTCSTTGLTTPVHTYTHDDGACSVTGGFVYRGDAIPALRGRYLFADYCAGWVRSFHLEQGQATDLQTHALGDLGNILSFGEDSAGDLYVLTTRAGGSVYRLVPAP